MLENGLFEVRLDLLEEFHEGSVPACQTAVIGGVSAASQREREQALAYEVLGPLRSR